MNPVVPSCVLRRSRKFNIFVQKIRYPLENIKIKFLAFLKKVLTIIDNIGPGNTEVVYIDNSKQKCVVTFFLTKGRFILAESKFLKVFPRYCWSTQLDQIYIHILHDSKKAILVFSVKSLVIPRAKIVKLYYLWNHCFNQTWSWQHVQEHISVRIPVNFVQYWK